VAVAASAVVVFLVPATGVLGRLFAAAILVAIVVSLLILDRAKLRGPPAHRTLEDQDADSLKAQDPTSSALPYPPPWSIRPSHRGTFNPEDGLDSMISPLSLPEASEDAWHGREPGSGY
jgi:hypothetical protein